VSTSERIAFLRKAYRRFNDRQIDGLLQMMTDEVEWPDVANNAVLHGKHAIRSYWQAQFSAGDPHVDPVDFIEAGDDLVVVVDQRVADREGRPRRPTAPGAGGGVPPLHVRRRSRASDGRVHRSRRGDHRP